MNKNEKIANLKFKLERIEAELTEITQTFVLKKNINELLDKADKIKSKISELEEKEDK